MANKPQSKRVKKKKLGFKTETNKGQSEQTQEEEKTPFDFGGLPSRDIKKNLGCG